MDRRNEPHYQVQQCHRYACVSVISGKVSVLASLLDLCCSLFVFFLIIVSLCTEKAAFKDDL